ncbi:unnamed protein product [Linum trigynum]|uniref:Post-GPI attachment to proteins factor 3 n=1 Tax=Linum trigynum TaxID=586398 RepID=A0AAV2G4F1_9ROSI
MDWSRWVVAFVTFFCLVPGLGASDGDADPIYKSCVEECQTTGCVGKKCFQHCKLSSDGKPIDGPWYHQEPLYQRWKQWDCQSDCQYHCMISREDERSELGLKPVKYHGRWPFHRVYGIQEPVSVALTAVILALQFHGWISFFILVYYKLPLRPDKKTYYEYTGLWHIYAFLYMNAWLWCAVYHTRDVVLTEKLYFSSTVAWVGFSLILATFRAFNIRDEAARVMIAAPVIAFVTTHILYLNFYNFDKGLNAKVSGAMTLVQVLIWLVWATSSRHPSRWKLWLVVLVGGSLSMLVEVYDFPPLGRYVDARAIWHVAAIPLGYIWWSFVRDDAEFRTSSLLKKTK